MHLLLSVPRVEGADLRPWVPPEHSLVISSARNPARSGAAEVSRDSQDGSNVLDWVIASFLNMDIETDAQMSVIKLKVSSLHHTFRSSSTARHAGLAAFKGLCHLHGPHS